MSLSLTLGLAGAAVLLFWAVGAYNRLVRLRARAIEAFAAMEQQFLLYLALVRSGLTPEEGEAPPVLAGLLGAAGQFDSSLKAARQQPLDDLAARALVAAHEALNEAWSRLRGEPPDLAGAPLPDTLQQQWQHIARQVETVRGEFNRCVLDYNAAIDLFPARLLAALFQFKHAHTI